MDDAEQSSCLAVLCSFISSSCHLPSMICPSVVILWTDGLLWQSSIALQPFTTQSDSFVSENGLFAMLSDHLCQCSHPRLQMNLWNLWLCVAELIINILPLLSSAVYLSADERFMSLKWSFVTDSRHCYRFETACSILETSLHRSLLAVIPITTLLFSEVIQILFLLHHSAKKC